MTGSIVSQVPGIRPDARKRNVLVLLFYLVLLTLLLGILLPLR